MKSLIGPSHIWVKRIMIKKNPLEREVKREKGPEVLKVEFNNSNNNNKTL